MLDKTLTDLFVSKTRHLDRALLRVVDTKASRLCVRRGVLEAPSTRRDFGLMVTLFHDGGYGYAAQGGLSEDALTKALEHASHWMDISRRSMVPELDLTLLQPKAGEYASRVEEPWDELPIPDRIELLREIEAILRSPNHCVESYAGLEHQSVTSTLLDQSGTRQRQSFDYVLPSLFTAVEHNGDVQKRSFVDSCSQGGVEEIRKLALRSRARTLCEEAVALSKASNCPTHKGSLLLMPDQMMLQIHESIGHPIELDRILGDERNYAGTSFVNLDMFGTFQYGSRHLNVTFDPYFQNEFASYAFDDDGQAAEKMFLIQDGILKAPLGGTLSSKRASLDGASSTRACNWNRPPIDRMANINIEPGSHSLEDMIASVERGVLMKTNTSWSIDDSRNKFQFSCEYGQLIENGTLGDVVKTPSYRGISSEFWTNLVKVGNQDTVDHHGTPFCGKGEPNQLIRVGHASPACLFESIDIFGGGL